MSTEDKIKKIQVKLIKELNLSSVKDINKIRHSIKKVREITIDEIYDNLHRL